MFSSHISGGAECQVLEGEMQSLGGDCIERQQTGLECYLITEAGERREGMGGQVGSRIKMVNRMRYADNDVGYSGYKH